MTTTPQAPTPRLFVSAEDLGAALGVSARAVRSMAARRKWAFTRGQRGAMTFSRGQVAAALMDRGVPADDAAEIAASLTGMPKPKLTASEKPEKSGKPARRGPLPESPDAREFPKGATPLPAGDWVAQPSPSARDPFRTTSRSRAAHRKTA